MRAGACTVQPALSTEAATLVKQSASLARRRGHAQVTPLHVASAMLSSPTGLLRDACLLSHSHPLQCKALEFCFNVALNRLPATSSSVPMLGHGHPHHRLHARHHPPAISNALVAAFKRAQAHQRRGLVESQQQPLLTVKIELGQLIISILDDPSVSRVMRQGGFSSTLVKTNIEKAIPTDACGAFTTAHAVKAAKDIESEDMMGSFLEILSARKKKSIVVVGDSLPAGQAAVRRLMDMVNRGEGPENLRGIQFISIVLSTFVNMSVDEVQQKVAELKRHVRSCCLERGAVLYIGDLNWTAEYWCSSSSSSRGETGRCSYCPVESILREISKLAFGDDDFEAHETGKGGNLWLLSAATHQGYLGCRIGNPSLEILLGLHPVPAGSLGFILHHDGDVHSRVMRVNKSQDGIFIMGDGPSRFQSEIQTSNPATSSTVQGPISSNLPFWLRVHQEENKKENINLQVCVPPKDQCRYWNFMGSSSNYNYSQHHRLGRTLSFSSASPTSSSSFHDPKSFNFVHTHHTTWPISAPISRVCSPEHDEQRTAVNPDLLSSCSNTMDAEYVSRFRELSAQNLKILCLVLDREIPRHKEIIPDIASTILQSRSGMLKRRERRRRKEETWLLFEGNDDEAKEMIARELAFAIFGSRANYISIDPSSLEQLLTKALLDNPHRVIMVNNVDKLDYDSRICVEHAIVRGRPMRGRSGGKEDSSFGDAIIILSCKKFDQLRWRRGKDEEDADWEEMDLNLVLARRTEDDRIINWDCELPEAVDGAFLLNSTAEG